MTRLKTVKIVVLKESSMQDSIPQSSSFREETYQWNMEGTKRIQLCGCGIYYSLNW